MNPDGGIFDNRWHLRLPVRVPALAVALGWLAVLAAAGSAAVALVQLQWLAPLSAGMLAVAAGGLGGLLWLRGSRGGAPALCAAPVPGGWRVLGGRGWVQARLLAVRQGPLWLRLELGLDAEAGPRVTNSKIICTVWRPALPPGHWRRLRLLATAAQGQAATSWEAS
ncbi:hypothetical protein FYA99_04295 [Bordetella parapertussis]|uniref:Integral membrane protein n=2 Tax=Bordetella parapertussis TaxID=519 RepID=Q7W5I9_BORPA|nr:hypothetical protein [Bordetella parapertussis]AOB40266.1 hypothetical protein BBB43_16640 [Bordetella parapertussis]AUL44289.1 hypothetical protein BTL54_16740 [Bordetella parapertussis]AWP64194.1 hypothetical protein B7P06_16755 [Bordetella parapertussis]AWP71698.1 hypothetical protein B7O99_16745 [Bordetella parapertussis]AWP90302.1 hypothetical protein B7P05_16745 [Bordetella parapertussis]